MDAYKGKKGNGNGHIIRFYRESDLRIRLRVSIKSRLTEEVQPDYVVLTLPIGKPHQERPIKKTHQEGLDESVNIGFLQRAQKLFGNNEFAQFERQGKLQASV